MGDIYSEIADNFLKTERDLKNAFSGAGQGIRQGVDSFSNYGREKIKPYQALQAVTPQPETSFPSDEGADLQPFAAPSPPDNQTFLDAFKRKLEEAMTQSRAEGERNRALLAELPGEIADVLEPVGKAVSWPFEKFQELGQPVRQAITPYVPEAIKQWYRETGGGIEELNRRVPGWDIALGYGLPGPGIVGGIKKVGPVGKVGAIGKGGKRILNQAEADFLNARGKTEYWKAGMGADPVIVDTLDRFMKPVAPAAKEATAKPLPGQIPKVIDEETYLAERGASRQDIGDSALHKNIGTGRAKETAIEHQRLLDTKLLSKREQLRQEYNTKVASGEIRPPSRIESLIATAQGNPDNASVIAARELLDKRGIKWQAEIPKAIPEAAAQPPVKPPEPPIGKTAIPENPDDVLKEIATFIHSEESLDLQALTKDLRAKELGRRTKNYQDIMEEQIRSGRSVEDANKIAKSALAGEFGRPEATLSESMAKRWSEAGHNKIYEVLAGEPLEEISTITAFTNALAGKGIPRDVGTTGGSAYTRLSRIFPKEVLDELDKKIPFEDIIDKKLLSAAKEFPPITPEDFAPTMPMGQSRFGGGVFEEPTRRVSTLWDSAGNPIRTMQEIFDSLKAEGVVLRKAQQDIMLKNLDEAFSKFRSSEPRLPTTPVGDLFDYGTLWQDMGPERTMQEVWKAAKAANADITDLQIKSMWKNLDDTFRDWTKDVAFQPAPIKNVLGQLSLIPLKNQFDLVGVLKEIGLTALDIGNGLRAVKASFDNSFMRQLARVMPSHPVKSFEGIKTSWKAVASQEAADNAWQSLIRKPDYQLYEEMVAKYGDGDFIRPLYTKEGTPVYKMTEEYGYLSQQRPVPQALSKVPGIRHSNRGFITGSNEILFPIFEDDVRMLRKEALKVASGEVKLPAGKAFDFEKNLHDKMVMLADMSARASLGPAKAYAKPLSAAFFAPRKMMADIIYPRHLISTNPYVRKDSWKTLAIFAGTTVGLELAGEHLGLWEIGKDRNSPNFMRIRMANTWIDPWGGALDIVKLADRLLTGHGTSATTGVQYDSTDIQTIVRYMKGRLHPGISTAIEAKTGKTYVGEDVNYKNVRQWLDRIGPMVISDAADAVAESGSGIAAATLLPNIMGLGTQSYRQFPEEFKKIIGSWYEEDFKAYEALPKNALELKKARIAAGQTPVYVKPKKGWFTTPAKRAAAGLKTLTSIPEILSRLQYREANPEIDARLFITGQVSSILTKEAKAAVERIVSENQIDIKEIRGVKATQEELDAYEKAGVPNEINTFTESLVTGKPMVIPEKIFIPIDNPALKKGGFTTPAKRAVEAAESSVPVTTPPPARPITKDVIGKFNSKNTEALYNVWIKGRTLTAQEDAELRKIFEQMPLGQTNFNTWLKQTLRQKWDQYFHGK